MWSVEATWLGPALAVPFCVSGILGAVLRRSRVGLRRGGGRPGQIVRLPGGAPAAAVVAGVLVGLLLGPGVLGHLSPQWYHRLVGGAWAEADALTQLREAHRSAYEALAATGATEVALEELVESQTQALVAAERRYLDARRGKDRAAGAVSLALVAIGLLSGGWSMRRWGSGERVEAERTAGLVGAVAGAIMAAACAAIPTALVLIWLMDVPVRFAVGVGSAVAAGSVLPALVWRGGTTSRAGPTAVRAAAMLSVLAAAMLAWASPTECTLWMLLPALGLGAGVVLHRCVPIGRWMRRMLRAVLVGGVLPGLTAVLAARVDPARVVSEPAALIVLAVGLVTAGDGQFFGAWLGLQAMGSSAERARAARIAIDLVGAGVAPTQLIFATVLLACGALAGDAPSTSVALGLILVNAVVIELTTDAARRAARRLDHPGP